MRSGVAAGALLLGLWPVPSGAGGWQTLDGPAITAALSARVLGYADGTLQDFFADGRTLKDDRWGRWEVRGDLYCAAWPPSARWTCYSVARDGIDLRFTDGHGMHRVGRYVDLP